MAILKLILFSSFASYVWGAKIPDYIKPCHRSDENLDKCALERGTAAIPHIIKGDKDFKIPPLDPLMLPEVIIEENQLSITLKNVEVSGFETLKLKNIKIDTDDKKFIITSSFDWVNVWSDYEMKGRILVLPVEGNGKANITFEKLSLTYEFKYELVKKKDENHMKIIDTDLKYELEGTKSHLTNLFNGDKRLGEEINNFLNENWKEVSKELGPAAAKVIDSLITSTATNLFDVVPYDEILPE